MACSSFYKVQHLTTHTIILIVSVLVLIACSGGGSGGGSNQIPNVAAQGEIGPSGGTVEVVDPSSELFGAKIEIPSGALDSTLSFTISAGVASDDPTIAGVPIKCEPSTSFIKPVKVTIPLYSSPSYNESYTLLVFNSDSEAYEPENSVADVLVDRVRATFSVDHFSDITCQKTIREALWLYDLHLIEDVEKEISYCEAMGINQIFLGGATDHIDNINEKLLNFITLAHNRGIKIHASTLEWPCFSYKKYHKEATDKWIYKIIQFNNENPKSMFDGISIDVEPHDIEKMAACNISPTWTKEGLEDNEKIMKQYVELLNNVRNYIEDNAPELEFSAAIAWWYDDEAEKGNLPSGDASNLAKYVDTLIPMVYDCKDSNPCGSVFDIEEKIHGELAEAPIIIGIGTYEFYNYPDLEDTQSGLNVWLSDSANFSGLSVYKYSKLKSMGAFDVDDDGILDDGDQSGVIGDNICTGGETLSCDDNCPFVKNPDQADSDGDGVGDVCEADGMGALPDTGQTTSYSDAFGEDSDYTINPPSYTKLDYSGNVLSDGADSWAMVKDNVTGLIWEIKTNDGDIHDKNDYYTWQDTQDNFIEQLNTNSFGGYNDWRLPEIEELSSLFNADGNYTSIDINYFPNQTLYARFWSSTPYAPNADRVWGGHFYHGGWISYFNKNNSTTLHARAVRGTQHSNTLVNKGNGTISDTTTGLMWQQDESCQINWEEAITYCESLEVAGYQDWRLPNLKELLSIVDFSQHGQAIDLEMFPGTQPIHVYWTSTTNVDDPIGARLIFFETGSTGTATSKQNSYNYCARAVRGGQ